MPSWRDSVRKCSWRGIECLYSDPEIDRGKRLGVFEYPGRDEADVEELGRKVRRYRIDLYLLASQLGAAEYWARRDRLVAAFDAAGAGTLVHPYYGSLSLFVEDVAERYSTREGGMVTFSVTFVSEGKARAPTSTLSTADALTKSATALDESTLDAFVAQWTTLGFSEFVRDGARRVLTAAQTALGLPDAIIDGINDALSIANILQAARAELATLGLPRIRELRAFGDDLPRIPQTTPSTIQEAINQQAVIDVVRNTTVAAAADVIADIDFDSVDEAISVRDELLDQIDERSATADTAIFDALRGVRTALVEDIRARGAGLPFVETITPGQTEPAAVLAHRLYGDARQAADIVKRNDIEHPGFVPGGDSLEVLSRV